MRREIELGVVLFVATIMVVPSMALGAHPMYPPVGDGAWLVQEYAQDGKKWLSNVTKTIGIGYCHGQLGTMTIKLYDPDGVLRQTWTANRAYTPAYVNYNLNNHFNVTGKISGTWHMHWNGHFEGDPVSGDDYLKVGMLQVMKTTQIGTVFSSNNKLAIGVWLPTVDGQGAVATIDLILKQMDGTGNRRDLRSKVATFYVDLMPHGGSTQQNA